MHRCSKVPDIGDVGLNEVRATLRISSQHIANWLGTASVTGRNDGDARTDAIVVDRQKGRRPELLHGAAFDGPAFRAACDLIFKGARTRTLPEWILHAAPRGANAGVLARPRGASRLPRGSRTSPLQYKTAPLPKIVEVEHKMGRRVYQMSCEGGIRTLRSTTK